MRTQERWWKALEGSLGWRRSPTHRAPNEKSFRSMWRRQVLRRLARAFFVRYGS
ncbi:unnamed protein product [Ectocarpus sp. 13 AM-2016]